LDRQEKGQGELSAIQEIETDYDIPIVSIINLQQILDYLSHSEENSLEEYLQPMQDYKENYGV